MPRNEQPDPPPADDAPIIPPPASAMVNFERKPVLYQANGTPLIRRIGF